MSDVGRSGDRPGGSPCGGGIVVSGNAGQSVRLARPRVANVGWFAVRVERADDSSDGRFVADISEAEILGSQFGVTFRGRRGNAGAVAGSVSSSTIRGTGTEAALDGVSVFEEANVVVDRNLIAGWRVGIDVGTASDVTATGNTIVGPGAGAAGLAGIQFGSPSTAFPTTTGAATGNAVSSYVDATGILVYADRGAVDVADNTFPPPGNGHNIYFSHP